MSELSSNSGLELILSATAAIVISSILAAYFYRKKKARRLERLISKSASMKYNTTVPKTDTVITANSSNLESDYIINSSITEANITINSKTASPNHLSAIPVDLTSSSDTFSASQDGATISLSTKNGKGVLAIPGYLLLDFEKEFSLLDKIGKGGSGFVYRAAVKNPKDGMNMAAVKIFGASETRASLMFEIALMGLVDIF
jgi:hypothetical protein